MQFVYERTSYFPHQTAGDTPFGDGSGPAAGSDSFCHSFRTFPWGIRWCGSGTGRRGGTRRLCRIGGGANHRRVSLAQHETVILNRLMACPMCPILTTLPPTPPGCWVGRKLALRSASRLNAPPTSLSPPPLPNLFQPTSPCTAVRPVHNLTLTPPPRFCLPALATTWFSQARRLLNVKKASCRL